MSLLRYCQLSKVDFKGKSKVIIKERKILHDRLFLSSPSLKKNTGVALNDSLQIILVYLTLGSGQLLGLKDPLSSAPFMDTSPSHF